MDNAAVHIQIHKKNRLKHAEISQLGEIQKIPAYYGENLFGSIDHPFKESVEKAADFILSGTPPSVLPPILQVLLKTEPEKLLPLLIEYYTRHKILTKFVQ